MLFYGSNIISHETLLKINFNNNYQLDQTYLYILFILKIIIFQSQNIVQINSYYCYRFTCFFFFKFKQLGNYTFNFLFNLYII